MWENSNVLKQHSKFNLIHDEKNEQIKFVKYFPPFGSKSLICLSINPKHDIIYKTMISPAA